MKSDKPFLTEGIRNEDGTFKKGNPGGPGRPPKKKIEDYVGEDEKEELVRLFISQARKKPELMKMLMEQLFGKARQNIGLDGGEEDKPISILTNALLVHNGNSEDNEPQEKD